MDNIEKDINEIIDYIKDLKEENRKQKEILDILKEAYYNGLFELCFNGKTKEYSLRDTDRLNETIITKKQYDLINKWLEERDK